MTLYIWGEILDERRRQDKEHGPNRDLPDWLWRLIMGEEAGELDKAMLEWVFEYPEAKEEDIRKELLETIAVGIAWIEDIDRRARRDKADGSA